MATVEISPEMVQLVNGKWKLASPLAHSGGGLFAIVAQWCNHCSTLKKNVPLAQGINLFDFFWMDGDKSDRHRAKAQQMGVEGFPMMYYINRDGIISQYNGGRSPDQMAQVFHRR